MEDHSGPRLLQAFLDHATDDVLDSMDNPSKAALRLSCKNAKAFVDGTVTTAKGHAYALEAILRCDWHLSDLSILGDYKINATISPTAFTSFLHAVCLKFPTLQVLDITAQVGDYDLPVNIGQLSNLRTLKIMESRLNAFPASFGQLSSLERFELYEFHDRDDGSRQLTIEGLAPLKPLTQLKYLNLGGDLGFQPFFPGWLGSCHFPVLEDLILSGGMPLSIGNFRSLTALMIKENDAPEVPESIGCLTLLKKFCIWSEPVSLPASMSKLTALEELEVTTDMQSFALVEHLNKLKQLAFIQQIIEGEIMPYPEFLWTFTSLQILNLWGSTVPSLPDALGNVG
jgi:Leucine-rich repeat (LRR) protein